MTRIVRMYAVPHPQKVTLPDTLPPQVRVNPPLAEEGVLRAFQIACTLREHGPFDALYTSRVGRAASMASAIALELDMDFESYRGLGQHGDKGGDGQIFYYPGYEGETPLTWQQTAVDAAEMICSDLPHGSRVITCIHRPSYAGFLAYSRGITDLQGVSEVLNTIQIPERGFDVFDLELEDESIVIRHVGG